MISSAWRFTFPFLGTIVGFFLVWCSFMQFQSAGGSPFTLPGLAFWTAGYLILTYTVFNGQSVILELVAMFLMISGCIAGLLGIGMFVLWILMFSVANSSGNSDLVAMVLLSALGYVVIPAYVAMQIIKSQRA
ncbi:hypothetical protein [Paracoccus sp. ME4]|uniref:hypothetical protein n=1 Tax=Paracoccus sp. ME4 TaxID=3138066 RepID=UPI00398B24B1